MAEGLSHQQERKAIEAAAAYRDILGPNNFFLEMQWHGIEEQRIVNSGLPAIARDLKLPLICTNDVHYLRESDAHPHDILLCIGTGKAFSDPKRLRYDSQAVLPEDAPSEMAEVVQGLSRTRWRTRCASPSGATSSSRRARTTCRTSTCRPGSRSTTTSSTSCAKASHERLTRLQQLASAGALRHTIDEYETRLAYEIEMIKQMEYPGTS